MSPALWLPLGEGMPSTTTVSLAPFTVLVEVL